VAAAMRIQNPLTPDEIATGSDGAHMGMFAVKGQV